MQPLQRGDTIGLVSPASTADAGVFDAMKDIAKERGYRIKTFGADKPPHGRMAAGDAARAQAVRDAFRDPDTKAILCTRGGYGSGRLLDQIDVTPQTSKIFVGYSDITSLLLHLNAQSNLITFHGPTAQDLTQKANSETLDWFFSVLEGRQRTYRLPKTQFTCVRPGQARGRLWGGNITMIESLLGTDSIRIPENAVLVLEDVNEFMYAFDRSLTHLRRAGIFEAASAILFSDLRMKDAGDRDNSLGLLLDEVIDMNFADFQGPIALNLPCGHTDLQMTLPLGAMSEIALSRDAFQLSFDDIWCGRTRHPLAA